MENEKKKKMRGSLMAASAPYFRAKKRLDGSATFNELVEELGKQFPSSLISLFKKQVLLCAIQHEEWNEDKILSHVTEEFDKRISANR